MFIDIYILDLPETIEDYHDVYPLDIYGHSSKILTYSTSTYRATYSKTGEKCCLKRIHGKRFNDLFISFYLLLLFFINYILLGSNLFLNFTLRCTQSILFSTISNVKNKMYMFIWSKKQATY